MPADTARDCTQHTDRESVTCSILFTIQRPPLPALPIHCSMARRRSPTVATPRRLVDSACSSCLGSHGLSWGPLSTHAPALRTHTDTDTDTGCPPLDAVTAAPRSPTSERLGGAGEPITIDPPVQFARARRRLCRCGFAAAASPRRDSHKGHGWPPRPPSAVPHPPSAVPPSPVLRSPLALRCACPFLLGWSAATSVQERQPTEP